MKHLEKSAARLGRRRIATTICLALATSLITFCASCSKKEPVAQRADAQAIRIGWQVAWATQGQIAMALQRTTALETMGLKGDFKSFTYGAPLSEAALAGQLDVAFVGDQPAVNLLSRSRDWRIVARLMDFRVAIVVPPNSPIRTVAALKGKTLGIPFGASTHRVALKWLREAGLDPARDVHILNIDITEQSDIVKSAAGKGWPKLDAFASWDHHIALFEKEGFARVLKSGTALGVVMMSRGFADTRADDAARFLAAYKLAYLYFAQHQGEIDSWFASAAGGKFDASLLKTVAAIESNTRATSLDDIKISIGPDQTATLQQAADFALSEGLIKERLSIENAVVSSPCEQAERALRTAQWSGRIRPLSQ